MSGNNRANDSKKAKVECNYDRDKKECVPNFFDYEMIQEDFKEQEEQQQEKHTPFNFFTFNNESLQKKRKIDSMFTNETDNNHLPTHCSTLNNDYGYINKRNKQENLQEETKIEPIISTTQQKIKSKKERAKENVLRKKEENDNTKKFIGENYYYRHINNLLKEIHFSRLERLRTKKTNK